MEWLFHPYTAQAMGFVAFGLGLFSFLSTDDRSLKMRLGVFNLTLAVHFALLGVAAGAMISMLSAFRCALSLDVRSKPLAPAFIAFYTVFGWWGYAHWVDVLPTTAAIISTIGTFYLGKVPMRWCLLTGTACWLVHNIVVGSIGPSVMEAILLVAIFRTIMRLRYLQGPIIGLQAPSRWRLVFLKSRG